MVASVLNLSAVPRIASSLSLPARNAAAVAIVPRSVRRRPARPPRAPPPLRIPLPPRLAAPRGAGGAAGPSGRPRRPGRRGGPLLDPAGGGPGPHRPQVLEPAAALVLCGGVAHAALGGSLSGRGIFHAW